MTKRHKSKRTTKRSRRGSIVVMVAITIPVLLILTAFAVNVAYMQMIRSQLRVACDASSKAALLSLGQSQSQTTARTFASTVASRNLVAGQTVSLTSSNIIFGNSTQNSSTGVYTFTAGTTPLNSCQVTGTVNPSLFMTAFIPTKTFNVSEVSLTTRVCYDICLVIDRSASMAFDQSSSEFVYPSDVSVGRNPLQCYFTPPSSTNSRWAALISAVNSFMSVLNSRSIDAHLALATYAETYSFGTYSATEATLDVQLTSTYSSITNALTTYGQSPLLGDTNISAGLTLAQAELTSTRARTTANRVIILLTDGVPTTGNTNIASITSTDRTSSQIVTNVITFGAEASSGANQTAMQSAATNGNGKFYAAPSASALTTAFQNIADSLPAVLIK